MTCRPFMPLFVGDYLGDTQHLSRSEHGGYLLLLMNYWTRGGPLPDDDKILREITRSTRYAWQKLRKNLQNFFTVEDGVWRHKRVDLELAKIKHKRDLTGRNEAPACPVDSRARAVQNQSQIIESAPAEQAPRAPDPTDRASPTAALSIFERGKEVLGPKYLGLLGAMLKRFGRCRVSHALDEVERIKPRSADRYFRGICEGREPKPAPAPARIVEFGLARRLMREQGLQKAREAAGLPPKRVAA